MKTTLNSVYTSPLFEELHTAGKKQSRQSLIRLYRGLSMFLFLHIQLSANSQTYFPLPTSNAQWNCSYAQGWFSGPNSGVDGYEMSYIITGDTLIGGITYSKLNKSVNYTVNEYYSGVHFYSSTYEGISYAGCFRNDSINQRVYYMPVDSSNEKLLYDFSLQVGDTVGDWWNSDYNPLMYTIIVESEDSILVNGTYRRRLKLTETANDPGYLIEGIGSTFGLLNPLAYFENIGSLDCFSVNGQTLFPDGSSPCMLVDQINDLTPSSTFSIHPNPAKEFIYLNVPVKTTPSSYEITDCTGKIIQTGRVLIQSENEQSINISNLPAGFYFLSVINDTETQASRFMKY